MYPDKPCKISKKILIAGAGPAGLTVAAILAQSGFQVILCEKSNVAAANLGLEAWLLIKK